MTKNQENKLKQLGFKNNKGIFEKTTGHLFETVVKENKVWKWQRNDSNPIEDDRFALKGMMTTKFKMMFDFISIPVINKRRK